MDFDRLKAALSGMDLRENEPMARHTSFQIGGPARLLVRPRSEQELRQALTAAKACGVPCLVIGNGSNLLVPDEGVEALVIRLGGGLDTVNIGADGTITAGSGALLSAVAVRAQQAGLTGLEFAFGIPGSIGGAVYMNAGAYGGQISDVVESVSCLTRDGQTQTWTAAQADFAYRHSAFQSDSQVITAVRLHLMPGAPEEIRRRMEQIAASRKASQPLELPSAGSAFKRPAGGYAAALIDQAGLKGTRVGGACVSEKHAGFIVNTGGASCRDVLQLMELVRARVQARTGIELEPEIRLLHI